MSAIAQGILTNYQYTLECLPTISMYGTFGGDIYSTSIQNGMPIAITTTIRMIGFVVTDAPASPSDTFVMTIHNITSGISASRTFSNWVAYTLNSQALATPLEVTQGDVIYFELLLNTGSTTTMNITQVLALYDLVTLPA